MCCEICPRYTNCEEEGNLNDLCCVGCPDYSSCDSKKESVSDDMQEESEDKLDEI